MGARDKEPQLSLMRKAFCLEYVRDWDGAKAWTRAGGTAEPRAAAACASRALTSANVVAEVKRLMASVEKRTVVDKAWVRARLVENVSRAMVAEPVRDSEGNATGEYVYEGSVANGALKLLGQSLDEGSMFGERVEHSVDAVIQSALGKLTEAIARKKARER